MKISGCMIARNEEPNIAKCINNLKQFADEIIVVDTGSEDNTVQIAKELGALVYEHKWENDFSKAKNTALQYASGDWIVFLDADECFSGDTLPKIKPVIQKAHANRDIEGIICEIVNIDKDTGRVIGNNAILRIFKNNKQFKFINRIHEEIRNNGVELKCANNYNDLTIMHTGYSSSLLESKTRRNLELLLDNTDDEKTAFYLASSYNILHDFNNAYKYADIALSDNAILSRDHLAYQMYLVKINSLLALEYPDKAMIQGIIAQAKQKYKNHPEIARAEANFIFMEKSYGKALGMYMYSLSCQEKNAKELLHNYFQAVKHEVYYNIAQILYLRNNEADALEYYVMALRVNKFYSDAFKRLLVLLRAVPENEVIAFVNSIYQIKSEVDVQFIISQVADCGRAKIVLYYASVWNNTFGHEDDALIYAFISQCNYRQALQIALLYLKNDTAYSPLVTSIVILGSLFAEAKRIRDDIGADYYEIVKCYEEDRKHTGNHEAYLFVLSILVKFMDQYDIENYLRLYIPGSDSEWDIAELFLANFQFERAVQIFAVQFDVQILDEMKALAAFRAGFCYYKLKQYRESLYWFEKAMIGGYAQNDLPELLQVIVNQSAEDEIGAGAEELLASYSVLSVSDRKKLHLGCGRDIKKDWINLDFMDLPGVDVVANLDTCRTTPLPFEDGTIDEILASHVIEHINNPIPMMQELYRIAKPNAKAVFRCPYGTSDDAFEDPTHVKQYYLHSFGYFSQPYYWKDNTGYSTDWCTDKIILVVEYNRYYGMNQNEILDDISKYRNTVIEMIAEMHAVKPPRKRNKELAHEPNIEIRYR